MTLDFAERITYDSASPWIAEDVSRYLFVATSTGGKDVLDVACGVALGHDAIVRSGARKLLGIDVSLEALREARANGGSALYCQADAQKLPLISQCFDVCLSFETIEHLPSPEAFVASLAQVLKSDGCLYLSTPNSRFWAKAGTSVKNPFHLNEFDDRSFVSLLNRSFSKVTLLGQRVDPQFGACPYWDTAPESAARFFNPEILWWKFRRRLQQGLGNKCSWLWGSRPLFPGPGDFLFSKDTQRAHSLLAICRGPLHE